MSETKSFMLRLAECAPLLSHLFRDHQRQYDEMLPHVLMADVSRAALTLAEDAQSGSASAEIALKRLVDELERGLQSGGDAVEELVVVSFLENMDDEDPRFGLLEENFGPQLRWEWSRLGGV